MSFKVLQTTIEIGLEREYYCLIMTFLSLIFKFYYCMFKLSQEIKRNESIFLFLLIHAYNLFAIASSRN